MRARAVPGNETPARPSFVRTPRTPRARASGQPNGPPRTFRRWTPCSKTKANQLLGSYEGVTGIKTGTSTPAGLCLVFAATRGDKTVVGIVLNSTNQHTDAAALLDYGFRTSTAKTMKLRKLPAGAQRD
ncbi:hypothetical protein [Streptomyces scopuliridis]|uniref:hypothetical protein n=1 Tax=Streptomyces scopuliridis TaxID=452529 RepID=UPI0036C540A6